MGSLKQIHAHASAESKIKSKKYVNYPNMPENLQFDENKVIL
jgi:hypothetical protein